MLLAPVHVIIISVVRLQLLLCFGGRSEETCRLCVIRESEIRSVGEFYSKSVGSIPSQVTLSKTFLQRIISF